MEKPPTLSTPSSLFTLSPETLEAWLFERVCPFWINATVAETGGFYESLDGDGKTVFGNERSTLNQARLTYVFSHAHFMKPSAPLRKSAAHGFLFLSNTAQITGEASRWHRKISVDGTVLDETHDFYDHAFVIFSMAWHYRAFGNARALVLADRAYQFLESHLLDPSYGGFFEEYPVKEGLVKLPRRQNPHMHLLEATLAMFESTRLPLWLSRSTALVELFKKYFFDKKSGSLIEYFNSDWSPVEGERGLLREPGHHFEWVWLLHQYFRNTADPRILEYAQCLFNFGTKYGIDREGPLSGLVFDTVDSSGIRVADSKLLWPQTEYVKACIAFAEWKNEIFCGDEVYAHIRKIYRFYFREDGSSWQNQLSRSGAPLQRGTPTRILYHLFLAIAEAVRFYRK
jgi:mannose/cellobiose epimerase-like protein (N-acyl-D-glucosamine 2-epimerase family)